MRQRNGENMSGAQRNDRQWKWKLMEVRKNMEKLLVKSRPGCEAVTK